MFTTASSSTNDQVPARAGVGLKAEHYRTIVETLPSVGFFEVHAENYMGDGGPPHRYLTAVRQHYPLSLHGVGLSIGADWPLDRNHLRRLKVLLERYSPALFSEHLAWSTHNGAFLNDLLPIAYSKETLCRVVAHITEVQEALGRQMLLENPSTYLTFAESTYREVDFIAEVARRSGCGLLLDINNVHIACTNHQWSERAYLDQFPLDEVQEIHLAGHTLEFDESDRLLLIDTHDRPVNSRVWNLYRQVIDRVGPVPTLIEWDAQVPSWTRLQKERSALTRSCLPVPWSGSLPPMIFLANLEEVAPVSARKVAIYYAWSRPAEISAPLGVIDNRFPGALRASSHALPSASRPRRGGTHRPRSGWVPRSHHEAQFHRLCGAGHRTDR